uniref:Uncharacterized protein n=1 Tax=Arcella intermedia TaxID=1963864 RepID=A0A6B2KWB1_9EUKA
MYNTFISHWQETLSTDPTTPMIRVIIKFMRKRILLTLLIFMLNAIFSFVPAFLLSRMVNFVADPSIPVWHGILYTIFLLVASLLSSLGLYHSRFLAWMIGLDISTIMITSTYRKAMRIHKLTGENIGQMINMITFDAQFIFEYMDRVIHGVGYVVTIIVAILYLSAHIGFLSLFVFGFVVLATPLLIKLAQATLPFRIQLLSLVDTRLKLVTELINAIRIIKLYAWEEPMLKRIEDVRAEELVWVRKIGIYRCVIIFVVNSITLLSLGTVFLCYGDGLNLSTAFTVMAIMNLLRVPIIASSMSLMMLQFAKLSLERWADFLKQPEKGDYLKRDSNNHNGTVSIENGNLMWNPGQPTLKNINLQIKNGEKVFVVGKMGSGKTSLIKAVLGEIPHVTGHFFVNGKVAYVSQEAWVLNSSIKDNIVFGEKYDSQKYRKVIEVTNLVEDFKQWGQSDNTQLGEATSLSGGQKQRISLARALYSDRDIYLLDDPLSFVDSQVSKSLFSNVIQNYLKHKTVIMVTNQLQYLSSADRIIFLHDGEINGIGDFKTLMETNRHFHSNLEKFGFQDNEVVNDEELPEEATPDLLTESQYFSPIEEKQSGVISYQTYLYYAQSGGYYLCLVAVFVCLLFGGFKLVSNLWLRKWAIESMKYHEAITQNEAGDNEPVPNYSKQYWSGTYTVWLLVESTTQFILLLLVITVILFRAATRLHSGLMKKLINGTMTFFDVTPIGRIVNRLSYDMVVIDTVLPTEVTTLLVNTSVVLASLTGIVIAIWYWFFFLVPLLVLFYFLHRYFTLPYVEIQRLESLSKAPIITHLNTTIQGIELIRSFDVTETFIRISDKQVNFNNVEKHAMKYANIWFGLRLDMIGIGAIFLVYASITFARQLGGINEGETALALSFTSGIVSILALLNSAWANNETRMNSVERFLEYEKSIPQEMTNQNTLVTRSDWPKIGKIEFKGLSFKYHYGPLVLKDLSFTIQPKSKTAIVGRTGAGKSSLFRAIYRLNEPESGTIMIDDVDYRSVATHHIRSKLSIIPQDPTLFQGSLRYNLDPFNEYTDDEIWDALHTVQLTDLINVHPDKLNQIVSDSSSMSVGQRQLLCMVRAVLKQSTILLLDEATASVDVETDALIQHSIRKVFKDCTVITIAHRLNTIMDNDMVLVLDKGQLVEADTPYNLLSQKGLFYSMVQATGPSTAKYLERIATGEATVFDHLKDFTLPQRKPKTTQQQFHFTGSLNQPNF